MSLEWYDFVGGWVGGICSTCIAFPADTVKTRLQVITTKNCEIAQAQVERIASNLFFFRRNQRQILGIMVLFTASRRF